jgi:hypothetical protein
MSQFAPRRTKWHSGDVGGLELVVWSWVPELAAGGRQAERSIQTGQTRDVQHGAPDAATNASCMTVLLCRV